MCVCSICSLSCPVSRNESHGKRALNMEREEVDRPALFVYCTTLYWEIMLREHTFWGVRAETAAAQAMSGIGRFGKSVHATLRPVMSRSWSWIKITSPLRVGTYSRASSRTCMRTPSSHCQGQSSTIRKQSLAFEKDFQLNF